MKKIVSGVTFRPPPKSPPGSDETFDGRATYDLAYALLSTIGGAGDYGAPLTLTRKADDGSTVTTTYTLNASQGEL